MYVQILSENFLGVNSDRDEGYEEILQPQYAVPSSTTVI